MEDLSLVRVFNFVMEKGGTFIGQVACSRTEVTSDNGRKARAYDSEFFTSKEFRN